MRGLIRHRSVMIQVETIASHLPNSEMEDGVVQGISHGGNPHNNRKDDVAAFDEQQEIQRRDGLQRKVAWAAEDSIQEGANDSSQKHSTLLGERKPDGTFVPIGRQYEGRLDVAPDDVPLVRTRLSFNFFLSRMSAASQAPSVGGTQATEGTQLIDEVRSSVPPTPHIPRTSELVPSSVESSPISEIDADFGMQKLAISEGPPQEISQVLGMAIPL
jgi:hypothetical protein